MGPGGLLPQQVRGRPAAGFPRLSPQAAAAHRSRAPKGLRSSARPSRADTPGPSGGLPGALPAGPERSGVCTQGQCGEPRAGRQVNPGRGGARSTRAVGRQVNPCSARRGECLREPGNGGENWANPGGGLRPAAARALKRARSEGVALCPAARALWDRLESAQGRGGCREEVWALHRRCGRRCCSLWGAVEGLPCWLQVLLVGL